MSLTLLLKKPTEEWSSSNLNKSEFSCQSSPNYNSFLTNHHKYISSYTHRTHISITNISLIFPSTFVYKAYWLYWHRILYSVTRQNTTTAINGLRFEPTVDMYKDKFHTPSCVCNLITIRSFTQIQWPSEWRSKIMHQANFQIRLHNSQNTRAMPSDLHICISNTILTNQFQM